MMAECIGLDVMLVLEAEYNRNIICPVSVVKIPNSTPWLKPGGPRMAG